jgi:hypothetical protein
LTIIDRAARRPSGTARARAGQVAGAFAIDVLSLAVVASLAVAGVMSGHPDLGILGCLVLAGFIVAQLRSWSRSGRTLGLRVTGVRQVSALDGAPPGLGRLLGSNWLADVRNARDPVDPEITVPLLAPVSPAGGAPASPRTETAAPVGVAASAPPAATTSRALLVVDGRVGGAIGDGVVLGRNPTPTGAERAVAVADIGREISKVHLGLSVDEAGRVWAVDRNSTNGSTLTRRDGVTERLTPGTPVELTIGDAVQIGSHTVAVQFVTEVRVASR